MMFQNLKESEVKRRSKSVFRIQVSALIGLLLDPESYQVAMRMSFTSLSIIQKRILKLRSRKN
jgi:hypothetical protein